MGFGYGFGGGFQLFSAMFAITFILFIGVFLFTIIRGLGEWNKNNHSPRLSIDATLVSKRMNVSHHHRVGEHHTSRTSTSYYVTFQVPSGDRMEFHVSGSEYGMLVEGDQGILSFQGTRYLGFERT